MTAAHPRRPAPLATRPKNIRRKRDPAIALATFAAPAAFAVIQFRPAASKPAITPHMVASLPIPTASPPHSNPHSPLQHPAISCLGAFRTPANTARHTHDRVASENLHISGLSATADVTLNIGGTPDEDRRNQTCSLRVAAIRRNQWPRSSECAAMGSVLSGGTIPAT